MRAHAMLIPRYPSSKCSIAMSNLFAEIHPISCYHRLRSNFDDRKFVVNFPHCFMTINLKGNQSDFANIVNIYCMAIIRKVRTGNSIG